MEENPTVDKKEQPSQPTITPEEIQAQADAIAQKKVEALKAELAQSISGRKPAGRYGENGPESWDKLHDSIKEDAVREAEQRIEQKFKAKEEAEKRRKAETDKEQMERLKTEAAQLTQEWTDAVADGLLPDIAPDIKKKLTEGAQYADLTEEERNDEGLKAYNNVRMLHAKLKSEGKSNSLYRTVQRFYGAKPKGANAPVFGVGSMPSGDDSDLSYDEIAENRKKIFGF